MMRGNDAKVAAAKDAEINKLTAENARLTVELLDLKGIVAQFEADLAGWRAAQQQRDAPPAAPAVEWTECKTCGDAFYPGQACYHRDPKCPMVTK